MKICLTSFVFFINLLFVFSQNLVVNPSFEITNTNCSNFGGEGYRSDLDPSWDNANSNIPGDSCSSPDLFSACNLFAVGMPSSLLGWQYAQTGTRYVGIILYEAPFGIKDNYREYIQGHTSTPLVAGQTYCVSFYVSLADKVQYASDNIGLYFSNTHVLRDACNDGSLLNFTPQLTNNCGVLLDTANWVRLQWTYTATGGEQYFIIGNFKDKNNTNIYSGYGGALNPYAYYFIEDVSIVPNTCCYAKITNHGPSCISDPSFNLSVSGGDCTNPSITGTWSGTGITNASLGTFDPATAGSGTHTIKFTATCGYIDSIQLVVSPCSMQVCQAANGSLTVSGGTGPYSWQDQDTTQDCSSCFIGCTFPPGCATSVTNWTQFASGTTITPPFEIPLKVIDNAGTEILISDTSTVPSCSSPCPSISVNITGKTNVTCFGGNNGGATVTASGGASPYTYTWNPGSLSGATQSSLSAGTFNIHIEDNNGCSKDTSVTISQPLSAPVINNIQLTNPSCGNNDGAIVINASGGTGTLTYSDNNGSSFQSGNTFSNLGAGSYTLVVKDANGCQDDSLVSLSNAGAPVINNIQLTNPSCGNNDGAIVINASGGTGTLTYSDNNGSSFQSGNTFSNLGAGSYTLVVKDANGCQDDSLVSLSNAGAPVIDSLVTVNTTCANACDGILKVYVSGGNPPYNYVWKDGAGNPIGTNIDSIVGLCAGNYSVEITDASGGGSSSTVYSEDFESGAPTWTFNVSLAIEGTDPNYFVVNDDEGGVTPPGCGIALNGDKTLHVTSVFNPSGGAAYDAGGLCGILYCPETHRQSETGLINTIGYSGLSLNFDYIANGDIPNDQATVWYNTGSGWTQLGGALFSGTGACNPQGIWTAYTSPLPVSCENISNLQIAIRWDNNDDGVGTDPSVAINNLTITTAAGGGGCQASTNGSISSPTAISINNLVLSAPSCGSNNGSITISASGGTGTLTYSNNNGASFQSGNSFTNLSSGTYALVIKDSNGCTKDSSVNLSNSNAPTIDTVIVTQTSCGENNGVLTVSASGGTGTLNYSNDNGLSYQSSNLFNNLAPGNYVVKIKDASGCTYSENATINSSSGVTIGSINTSNPSCGKNNGSIDISITGGTPNYGFSINNGVNFSNDSIFNNLGAGTYSIIVKDANACTDTSQIIFAPSSSLTLTNLLLANESCTGANGAVTIVISGGNAPYNYSLNGGSTQSTAFFDSLSSGLYTFQVTDLSGCTLDSNFTILNVPSSVMNIPDQTLCGQQYQVAGITAGGGIWSADTTHISFSPDSSALNPLIKSDTSGVFTIYYTNASCSYASGFQLTFKPFPYTQILDTLICSGDEYTINALNMSQNDAYLWNTGEKGSSIKITAEGTYTVTASNDCGQYTDTAVISLQICDLEVPNVFTPNGDGSNDYFKLIYEIGVKEFSCVIVNRWGNTMRSFDKADFKWDGKDASGKLADEGTYFYIIKAKTPGGSEIKKQGFVQLVKQ